MLQLLHLEGSTYTSTSGWQIMWQTIKGRTITIALRVLCNKLVLYLFLCIDTDVLPTPSSPTKLYQIVPLY